MAADSPPIRLDSYALTWLLRERRRCPGLAAVLRESAELRKAVHLFMRSEEFGLDREQSRAVMQEFLRLTSLD